MCMPDDCAHHRRQPKLCSQSKVADTPVEMQNFTHQPSSSVLLLAGRLQESHLLHGLGVLGLKLDVLNDGPGVGSQVFRHGDTVRIQPIQWHEGGTSTFLSVHNARQLSGHIVRFHHNIEEAVTCRPVQLVSMLVLLLNMTHLVQPGLLSF